LCPGEDHFDFHQRDRDIHILTFSHFRTIKGIQFNHHFGMTITHDYVKKKGLYRDQKQQLTDLRKMDKVNENIMANGMINRLCE
jgi:hypothetical protein